MNNFKHRIQSRFRALSYSGEMPFKNLPPDTKMIELVDQRWVLSVTLACILVTLVIGIPCITLGYEAIAFITLIIVGFSFLSSASYLWVFTLKYKYVQMIIDVLDKGSQTNKVNNSTHHN